MGKTIEECFKQHMCFSSDFSNFQIRAIFRRKQCFFKKCILLRFSLGNLPYIINIFQRSMGSVHSKESDQPEHSLIRGVTVSMTKLESSVLIQQIFCMVESQGKGGRCSDIFMHTLALVIFLGSEF